MHAGVINMVSIGDARYPAGGLIRCDRMDDRIPFEATSLVAPLTIADCLGRDVAFDMLDGRAVRVRQVRAVS